MPICAQEVLNGSSTDHARKMVLTAIDIAEFVNKSKQNTNNNARFEIR